jgi:hypothetical protein
MSRKSRPGETWSYPARPGESLLDGNLPGLDFQFDAEDGVPYNRNGNVCAGGSSGRKLHAGSPPVLLAWHCYHSIKVEIWEGRDKTWLAMHCPCG